jgi:hypothetical protein
MKTAKEWMKIQESIEVPESESEEQVLKRIENFIKQVQDEAVDNCAELAYSYVRNSGVITPNGIKQAILAIKNPK